MLQVLQEAMNMNTISAISSTILIILAGYFARKSGLFSKDVANILSNLVLDLALPALALTSFLMDFDRDIFTQTGVVLVWSLIIYACLIPIVKVFFAKYSGVEKNVLETLAMYGSKSFFGIPIVSAVYGPLAALYANVFQMGYRIWMYTHGSIKLSGVKVEKESLKQIFLNSAIIATVLGLLIWVFQDFMPQVSVQTADGLVEYGILRIDQTAPWLYKPLNYLSSMCSPLAWLSIGATLGETELTDALKDKTSWWYSVGKTLVIPAFNLIVMVILAQFVELDFETIAATTILMATPTATAIAAMGIAQGPLQAKITSWAASISTVASVITLPIWIVVLYVLQIMGVF